MRTAILVTPKAHPLIPVVILIVFCAVAAQESQDTDGPGDLSQTDTVAEVSATDTVDEDIPAPVSGAEETGPDASESELGSETQDPEAQATSIETLESEEAIIPDTASVIAEIEQPSQEPSSTVVAESQPNIFKRLISSITESRHNAVKWGVLGGGIVMAVVSVALIAGSGGAYDEYMAATNQSDIDAKWDSYRGRHVGSLVTGGVALGLVATSGALHFSEQIIESINVSTEGREMDSAENTETEKSEEGGSLLEKKEDSE